MEANELDTLRNRLQEREDELRNLRLSLDVLTPVDLATGLLNRNGLLEAIENAARWMERRREQFGVVAIMVPGIQDLADDTAGDRRLGRGGRKERERADRQDDDRADRRPPPAIGGHRHPMRSVKGGIGEGKPWSACPTTTRP